MNEIRGGVDVDALVRLHRAGLNDKAIAEAVGLSKSSISRRLRKMGLAPNKTTPRRGPVLPVTGRTECAPAETRRHSAACPVREGDSYTFRPSAWENFSGGAALSARCPVTVTGTVDRIYDERRWFLVRYRANGYELAEGFKF